MTACSTPRCAGSASSSAERTERSCHATVRLPYRSPFSTVTRAAYTEHRVLGIAEHAFSAPLGRRFDYLYQPAAASGACPVNFTAVPLGPALAGRAKLCEPSITGDQEYLRALTRLPVFGRWEFALGPTGWPGGVERPVSATLMFKLASSCPSYADHSLSVWSTGVIYSGGRGAQEAVPGSLCGVTARAETPPAPTTMTPPTTAPTYGSRGYSGNLAVVVGATSAAIVVVAAALAALQKRRQSSRAPTEPVALAAGRDRGTSRTIRNQQRSRTVTRPEYRRHGQATVLLSTSSVRARCKATVLLSTSSVRA